MTNTLQAIDFAGHPFCTDACVGMFKAQNMISCQRKPGCSEKFVKVQGIPHHGKWFCSDACVDKDLQHQNYLLS
jgi:hypothetical protein